MTCLFKSFVHFKIKFFYYYQFVEFYVDSGYKYFVKYMFGEYWTIFSLSLACILLKVSVVEKKFKFFEV